MRAILSISVLMFVLGASQIAIAHPADGLVPKDLPFAYGTENYGYPDGTGFADVTFQDSMPDPASLTNAEKYIIAGCKGMRPWSSAIFNFIDHYEKLHGTMPSVIDETAIRSVYADGLDEDFIETLRSPLTGQFPRTDQVSFSTGDVYCRKLTPAEIEEVCSFEHGLRKVVEEGQFFNPWTGQDEQAVLATSVYYIRVYGFSDVIYEAIQFTVSSR